MRLEDKLFEGIGFVSPFPVERVQIIFSTEVPVVGSFTVNRTEQFKLLDDRSRLEIENFANGFFDFHFVHRSRPKRIDGNADRIRISDRVSKLDFASVSQAGSNHVFRNVSTHVSRRTVHFGRIFPRERAAAVAAHSSVGIDNDLASGQTSIALRATDHKTTSWINEISRTRIDPIQRDDPFNGSLDQGLANLFVFNVSSMLGGDDNSVYPDRTIALILDRNLGLRVWTQPRELAGFSQTGELTSELMAQLDRSRH